MDSSKKRVGRPKSEPRTRPLVLDEAKSRQRTEVELTTDIASEFAEYAAWVEMSSSLTTADAKSTTVEFALRDLFRRDRVWRERQSSSERRSPPPPASATPRPAPSSPSLPAPISRDPRTTS
jgi:hypothetical protein